MSTYYMSDGVHGNSRIMQENNSDAYANENSEAASFDTANKFCLETQLWYGGGCNKDIASTSLRLEFRQDGGSWEQLGTDIAAYDCSGLTEGNAQTSTHCTAPDAAACASGFENGVQCTDGAISHGITTEYYSTIVWGLDPASAVAGSSYEFSVYDVTNNTRVPFATGDACAAYITIAAAAINVTPGHCEHSQSSEAPNQTFTRDVSPANAEHNTHTAEAPSQTFTWDISPSDCQHSQSAEIPAYTPIFALSPANCEHNTHTAETPAQTFTWDLTTNDCEHSQSAESPNFTVGGNIEVSPAHCQHGQTVESPGYTPIFQLNPVDCAHTQAAVSPSYTPIFQLGPSDCQHAQSAVSPSYTFTWDLAPNDTQHNQTCEIPTYTPIFLLSPGDCQHSQSVEIPVASYIWLLSPNDCQHAQACEIPVADYIWLLNPAACQHLQSSETPNIGVTFNLSPSDCVHGEVVATIMMDVISGQIHVRAGDILIGL